MEHIRCAGGRCRPEDRKSQVGILRDHHDSEIFPNFGSQIVLRHLSLLQSSATFRNVSLAYYSEVFMLQRLAQVRLSSEIAHFKEKSSMIYSVKPYPNHV